MTMKNPGFYTRIFHLARSRGYRQSLATPGATTLESAASAFGAHSLPKAVNTGATTLFWLICALGHTANSLHFLQKLVKLKQYSHHL